MKAIFTCYLLSMLLLFPFMGKSQLITISGIVSHQKSGKILEGVNIFETISKIGTISDKHGYFQLMLKTGDINISVTHDGYKDFNQKLVLLTDTVLNVNLEPKQMLKGKQKVDEEARISEIVENNGQSSHRIK